MVTAGSTKNGNGNSTGNSNRKPRQSAPKKAANRSKSNSHPTSQARRGWGASRSSINAPSWFSAVVSLVGVGVAVGAGLYATRKQWMPLADDWRAEFSGAFAEDETDYENFDQTRHAGTSSMRDDPGEDWEDVDDMSDASFPASDPPSFNPGTAG
jgi:hypothetical protein